MFEYCCRLVAESLCLVFLLIADPFRKFSTAFYFLINVDIVGRNSFSHPFIDRLLLFFFQRKVGDPAEIIFHIKTMWFGAAFIMDYADAFFSIFFKNHWL